MAQQSTTKQRLEDMLTPDKSKITEEYRTIELESGRREYVARECSTIFNRVKNRYANIVPCDKRRVILEPTDQPGSDYINASWVSGLVPDSENAYIATQCPTPWTSHDFWRMVTQTKSNVVVFLGDGTGKATYWPDNAVTPLGFSDIVITYLGESSLEEGIVCTRLLVKNKDEEARQIDHIHYQKWPDCGLPGSIPSILSLIGFVNERSDNKPIICHCSAGVGRTGTFLLIHSLITKLMQEGPDAEINIPQTLIDMRDERHKMVHARSQYEFVYRTILYYLTTTQ